MCYDFCFAKDNFNLIYVGIHILYNHDRIRVDNFSIK